MDLNEVYKAVLAVDLKNGNFGTGKGGLKLAETSVKMILIAVDAAKSSVVDKSCLILLRLHQTEKLGRLPDCKFFYRFT